MTTAGLPQHRDALRPCCPFCDSLNLKAYKRGTWRCYSCSLGFARPNMREAMTHRRPAKPGPVEKPKAAGSGVFGEPIRERPFRPLRYDMMAHARLNWR